MKTETAPAAVAEASIGFLFFAFVRVGLMGFGGVLPWVRRLLVDESRLLAAAEFNALLGICQLLPGPNVINLAVCVGARFQGWRGSVAAVLGMLLAPFLIVLGLVALYDRYAELAVVQGLLRGIAAAGCGLLLATALRMFGAMPQKRRFLLFTLFIIVAQVFLRWPLGPVLLFALAAAVGVAWGPAGEKLADKQEGA